VPAGKAQAAPLSLGLWFGRLATRHPEHITHNKTRPDGEGEFAERSGQQWQRRVKPFVLESKLHLS
jgi:hypothetical protein